MSQAPVSQALMSVSDWIALAQALFTALAIVIAIWGERIRAWLVRVKLRLAITTPAGELTTLTFTAPTSGGATNSTNLNARFYHVAIENGARVPVAHQVQVVLLSLEREGPNGQPQRVWTGPIPLLWQHQQIHPIARDVGKRAIADIFHIVERGAQANQPSPYLKLATLIEPNNLKVSYTGRTRIWLTIQAQSVEGDSAPLRVEIAWTGIWDAGEAEMAKNLVLTTTPLS